MDVDHPYCATQHGEDNTRCDKGQPLNQTSAEKLTHSKETTEQGETVTSTRGTDQPSTEPARITSCGKNNHQEQVQL